MLSLKPGAGKISIVRDLIPGQMFFLRAGGNHRLAVALQGANGHSIWLNLTGSKAFSLEASNQFQGRVPQVFLLPYTPDEIVLRIDERSASATFSEHNLGQLLISEQNGVCIAAGWPGLEENDYRNVVAPGRWEQERVAVPRYAFDSWAFSIIDPSGSWVDLVTRNAL
jgi:hypothetical protein